MLQGFGGIQIVEAAYWPRNKEQRYDFTVPAHRFIVWLSKYFPIKPYVEGSGIRYVDSDPVIMGGKLFCSPAQAQALRQHIMVQR